jgi:hypothetical protein
VYYYVDAVQVFFPGIRAPYVPFHDLASLVEVFRPSVQVYLPVKNVHYRYVITVPDKKVRRMATDESGAARYQYFHAFTDLFEK